jgi:peptidoglycan hydrolase-like protein with peptidoglycan-binding domain
MITRILKNGMSGEDVKELQQLLNSVGNYGLNITGRFDSSTESVVRLFQKENNLVSDGIVGQKTLQAINSILNKPNNTPSTITESILQTAQSFVGQKEIRGNMGFKDAFFMRLMESVGWRTTWSWCSLFCKLVYTEAYKKLGLDPKAITKYISPSVQKTRANFIKAGNPLQTNWRNVKPGAYISWVSASDRSKGHTGILVEFLDNGKKMKTIEGNTNSEGSREGDSVAIKTRGAEIGKGGSLILQGWFNVG